MSLPRTRRSVSGRNSLFLGTHVVSGTAKLLVAQTGKQTEFGKVADKLKLRPAETEFEHGVRRFGYFLLEVTLLLVIGIFAFNVYLARPVLDSLLFALALAVGLTPQLLPAIISVNLAHGAKRMARAEGHREAPRFHRKLRQHDRALFGQDRHADRRPGEARTQPRTLPGMKTKRFSPTLG